MPYGFRSGKNPQWDSSPLDDLSDAVRDLIKHEGHLQKSFNSTIATSAAKKYDEALQRRRDLVKGFSLPSLLNDVPMPKNEAALLHHLQALKDKELLSNAFVERYHDKPPSAPADVQARQMHLKRNDFKAYLFDKHLKDFPALNLFGGTTDFLCKMLAQTSGQLNSWYAQAAFREALDIYERIVQDLNNTMPGDAREYVIRELLPTYKAYLKCREGANETKEPGSKILNHLPEALEQIYTDIRAYGNSARDEVDQQIRQQLIEHAREVNASTPADEDDGDHIPISPVELEDDSRCPFNVSENALDVLPALPELKGADSSTGEDAESTADEDLQRRRSSKEERQKSKRSQWKSIGCNGPRPRLVKVTPYKEGRGITVGRYSMVQEFAQK